MLKIISLLLLLIGSSITYAAGSINVCKDEDIILAFEDRYKFEKRDIVQRGQEWKVEVPQSYDDELTLSSVSLEMFQTEMIGRKDRPIPRIRRALYVPVQMREFDGVSYGLLYTHEVLKNEIKLTAVYQKKSPLGTVSFDGKICEIELKESTSKQIK